MCTGSSFPWAKRSDCSVDHWPPSSAEVKNEWSCSLLPLFTFGFLLQGCEEYCAKALRTSDQQHLSFWQVEEPTVTISKLFRIGSWSETKSELKFLLFLKLSWNEGHQVTRSVSLRFFSLDVGATREETSNILNFIYAVQQDTQCGLNE